MLSIKTKFLLIAEAIYFSNPFAITLTSNLPISCIIKWLSQPFKLLNITGTFLVNLRLIPAGKYWSPGRPEDVPLQRPQDVH